MKTTILETIKRNLDRIKSIKEGRNKFIENLRIEKDSSSLYTIRIGDTIIVKRCSLNFILGDPLGFLNQSHWVVKARIYQDSYCNDSMMTIKFMRYEDEEYVIFLIDILTKEQKLLINTNKHSFDEPRLIRGADKDTFSLHLVGNKNHIFCTRCGRLQNKHTHSVLDMFDRPICKDVCEKYTTAGEEDIR